MHISTNNFVFHGIKSSISHPATTNRSLITTGVVMDPLKLWGKPLIREEEAKNLLPIIIEAKEYARRMLGYGNVVEGPSPEDLVRALVYGFKVEEGICGNVVVNFGNGEFTVMPPLKYEAFTIAYSYILSKLFNDS